MAQYATASELATYLQKDLDTASANLALTTATAIFIGEAGTTFSAVAGTYSTAALGEREVFLPGPVTAVSAVRVNGVAITDYTRIGDVLYRSARFGTTTSYPPDVVEVDYTAGYTSVPDDVKLAVLQLAGELYENPHRAVQRTEQIDDYSLAEKFADGAGDEPVQPGWREVAAKYRGVVVA